MKTPAPVRVDRLRASQDIRAVFAAPERRAGRYVVLHVRRRDDDQPARVAVIASRRVGAAVARNRAKRVLREAARHCDWRGGLDLVLVARGPATTASMAAVRADLLSLAEHLDLLAVAQL